MKKLLLIVCLFISALSYSQSDSLPKGYPSPKGQWGRYNYLQSDSGSFAAPRDTNWIPRFRGAKVFWLNPGVDTAEWLYLGAVNSGPKWVKSAAGSSSGGIHPGGEFTTSNVEVGFNPGTDLTWQQIIDKVWYGLKPPTATLSGGTMLEYTAASTVSATLNWGAGRQSNTPILTSIVVAGVTQSFSQPSQGGSVSGTQAVTIPANVNITYSNVVTAEDGQTATATTSFPFAGRKYYGWVSDTTGIGTGTQDAVILALTDPFALSRALNISSGNPSGTQFFVYAYPSSFGELDEMTFNGFSSLEAMNRETRSFTNALGHSETYIIYWNKIGQITSSNIIAE